MLRFLRVRNLAVIEGVDVEFESGFNVLTGETGAGKSILVGAVGLLLGARASPDLVRTGETLAVVEAGLDRGGAEIVLRRELSSQGRSRAFINGALATTSALRDAASSLLELHGQHEHQTLLDPLTHLPLLDEFAQLDDLVASVGKEWAHVRALREQAQRAGMDAQEKAARLDLIAFQLGELERVNPRQGEDEALGAARDVLASAERVQRLCEESYAALYESDGAILSGLGGVWRRVAELAALEPRFRSYVEARDGIKGQLEDLAFFLRNYADGIDASPARLQETEDRLASLERLKRKHGPTLDDVLERLSLLRRERDLLSGAGEQSEQVDAALKDASHRYLWIARDLSGRRKQAAGRFARRLEELLGELAMGQTRVEVRFAAEPGAEDWTERGIDRAEFYLSSNPGEDLRPLARIVSGGELSRVMLALKTLTRGKGTGQTLVFDEVDAGIGGGTAAVVGLRLRELSSRFQVLCITHLPQIAACAATHFRIEKRVRNGRTATSVERLSESARVEELGRMIGGAAVTQAVRATARDLLRRAVESPDAHVPGAGAEKPEEAPTGRKAKGESESRTQRRRSDGEKVSD